MHTTPPSTAPIREITIRVIILSIILTIILAVSNAYLALKIGILTSASIPAAIISMGVLRLFKNASILENNLVQTAASAGEAVAGGIVYTIPALIIIRYWTNFSYWENVIIALIGGVLGVLFSIPIRRILVTEPSLPFPEGRAIAEVLKAGETHHVRLHHLLWGSLAGGFIELAQTGFKVIANSWSVWFMSGRALFGFGAGFSPTMIGAGYLIGFNICASIMLGAIIGWLISIPIVSEIYPVAAHGIPAAELVTTLWWKKISYMGIGAMLFAGLWTVSTLFKPFYKNLRLSWNAFTQPRKTHIPRTERDMPLRYVAFGIFLILVFTYFFLNRVLPIEHLGLTQAWTFPLILSGLLYFLIIGFIFSVITGYFSGMVGVSATPGSAIIIAGLLLVALILRSILQTYSTLAINQHIILDAEAIVIVMGAIITGTAAIANDNIQDLKTGHLIGATPWKQQVMLLLGVSVSAFVIPPIMTLLFNVYGIADVLPHPNMDPSQTLPAPPAALMAAITRGVFSQQVPWKMVLTGMGIALFFIACNQWLKRRGKCLSVLGVAIGIYLPLASSTPLFIGGLIAWLTQRGLEKRYEKQTEPHAYQQTIKHKQQGMLLACGLIAGSVLMDVMLAIPFSIARTPDALRIMPASWWTIAVSLGVLTTIVLAIWFYRLVCGQQKEKEIL